MHYELYRLWDLRGEYTKRRLIGVSDTGHPCEHAELGLGDRYAREEVE